MRKGTPEQIAQRREEIINACEQLYQTTSFREITLKEIGKITSFSRPTIYNYFETKEEIFLALFKREYDRWNEQLTAIHDQNERLTKAQLADKIAQSLADRPQLLKLLSMNNFDMESVTEKQKAAMKEAGIDYVYQTVYELTHGCLVRLLGEQ